MSGILAFILTVMVVMASVLVALFMAWLAVILVRRILDEIEGYKFWHDLMKQISKGEE